MAGSTKFRSLAVSTCGAVLAVSLAATFMANRSPDLSATPESVVQGSEVYHFDDITTMTATAPLVVKATVQAVTPGRKLVFGEDSKQYRAVQLIVDQVYSDQDQLNPKTLILEEEGWDRLGNGYIFEGLTWSEPGDVAVFWLDKPQEGYFHYFTSQGRINLTAEGLRPTSDGPLGATVSSMTPGKLQEAILSAAAEKASGRIQPSLPFGGQK